MSEEPRPATRRFGRPLGPRVHSLLKKDWDPIGGWTAEDEYDSLVWPLIGKIMRGESVEEIADYLDWASNEHIGRPVPRETNLAVAQSLFALQTAGTTE